MTAPLFVVSYHRLTRANTPDSVSFRRFLPFSPWRAPARLRLKNQKSLENPSLAGALQFCRQQKCVQTRKGPQRILAVLSRGLTQYGRISARQNRVCPCQSMVLITIQIILYRIRLRFATFPLENFFRFLSNIACILLELLV